MKQFIAGSFCLIIAVNIVLSQEQSNPIGLYQRFISPLLSGDCRSYPSCSHYAQDAFASLPTGKAYISVIDRLVRCGNDHSLPIISRKSGTYKYDPVLQRQVVFDHIDKIQPTLNCLSETSRMQLMSLFEIGLFEEAIAASFAISDSCSDELLVFRSRCARSMGTPDLFIPDLLDRRKENPDVALEFSQIQLDNGNTSQILFGDATAGLDDVHAEYMKVLAGIVDGTLDSPKTSTPELEWNQNEQEAWTRFYATKSLRPGLAAILGALPGGGYLYVGQPESALSSILMLAIFANTTIWAIQQNAIGIALLSGTLTLSFYAGGIFGAAKSAQAAQRSKRKRLTDSLRSRWNY
jgi:putative component of membrane protein insertase Oxa1/YidC/SpoIIIJ protein YidD